MNITMQRRFFVLLGVTAVTFVLLAACSERSLQSLLDGEESGAFELTTREVHLQASDEFTITARGGFTPYYFDLDNGVGDIDTSTGRYRSPETLNNGQFIEVPVLAMDNAGATDSATVLLYERLSVDPRTLDVHTGEQGAEVEVGGGFGSYFFELEREDDGSGGTGSLGLPGEPDEEGVWHLTYNAPDASGSVLLRIRDELANRVTVEISVYPEEELRISPTSQTVVLNGAAQPITFEVSGGQGDPQDFELSLEPEDFGHVPPNAAGVTFEYTPPQEEGTATITVSDDEGSEAVAKVYVVADEPDDLVLSPSSVTVVPGGSAQFQAAGGIPPYEFRARPGGGVNIEKIDDSTALVSLIEDLPPGLSNGSWEIIVTDSRDVSISSTLHQDTETD